MKTYYLLVQTVWNGTIMLHQNFSLYPTKELAEKVREKLREATADDNFPSTTQIKEINFYSDESKVPILNETK